MFYAVFLMVLLVVAVLLLISVMLRFAEKNSSPSVNTYNGAMHKMFFFLHMLAGGNWADICWSLTWGTFIQVYQVGYIGYG